MSGFSADWLALREPFDRSARNPAVLDATVAALKDLRQIRIVDLACGTGSTLRALAPKLAAQQAWRLCDNDLGLLLRASSIPPPAGVTVATTPLDLNRDLEAALDGPVDLVTTSALLDLVSEAWLERLATEIAARRIPFYAALSYNGSAGLSPPDPFDTTIIAAVHKHQRTDKGFGPALGPLAASAAITRFKRLGYSVTDGKSDWLLGQQGRDLQVEILNGWASAARDIGVPVPDTVEWLKRRRAAVAAGSGAMVVGHVDFFAAPTGTR